MNYIQRNLSLILESLEMKFKISEQKIIELRKENLKILKLKVTESIVLQNVLLYNNKVD